MYVCAHKCWHVRGVEHFSLLIRCTDEANNWWLDLLAVMSSFPGCILYVSRLKMSSLREKWLIYMSMKSRQFMIWLHTLTKLQKCSVIKHVDAAAWLLKFFPSLRFWCLYISASNQISPQRQLENKHPSEAPATRVFPDNDQSLEAGDSASAALHCPTLLPLMFMHTKETVCIYGVSSDTFFNNSVIAICKCFHGSGSSQQEELVERWSGYRHFKMNNNFQCKNNMQRC